MNDVAAARSAPTALTEATFTDEIRGMLGVLGEVEDLDFGARATIRRAESEPLGALAVGLNELIATFARVRQETQTHQAAIEEQIATIEKQRDIIRELSTPIIEVWAGVLCVPIVGVLDSSRAADMASALLHAVVKKRASLSIIDITGIDVMDTRTTDHFLRMARSVRTLGGECVISGVSPNVAQTIVSIGVDMSGIRTFRSLRDALRGYVRRAETERAARAAGAQAALSQPLGRAQVNGTGQVNGMGNGMSNGASTRSNDGGRSR
jgi:rsbT co-antagonist protein RsbR